MSALTDVFGNIANAIRTKIGSSDTFTPAQMSDAIYNIPVGINTYDATATASDIAEGKTAYVNNSKLVGILSGNNKELASSYTVLVGGELTYKLNYSGSFYNQQTFNSSVTIGNMVNKCEQMFGNCINLNSPVIIGSNVVSCVLMFSTCTNFNQPITIPDSVTNCAAMFARCSNFNQPVTIGNNVIDCGYMFSECINLNSPVIIGNNVTNCYGLIDDCNNFSNNIYVHSKKIINIQNMFYNTNNSKIKNIFFNSSVNSIFNKTNSSSLVGSAITWTAMTNGFYNAAYNIYCYNNYS